MRSSTCLCASASGVPLPSSTQGDSAVNSLMDSGKLAELHFGIFASLITIRGEPVLTDNRFEHGPDRDLAASSFGLDATPELAAEGADAEGSLHAQTLHQTDVYVKPCDTRALGSVDFYVAGPT